MSRPPSRDENPWSSHMVETRSQRQIRLEEEERYANQFDQSQPTSSFRQSLEHFRALESTPRQEGRDHVTRRSIRPSHSEPSHRPTLSIRIPTRPTHS